MDRVTKLLVVHTFSNELSMQGKRVRTIATSLLILPSVLTSSCQLPFWCKSGDDVAYIFPPPPLERYHTHMRFEEGKKKAGAGMRWEKIMFIVVGKRERE